MTDSHDDRSKCLHCEIHDLIEKHIDDDCQSTLIYIFESLLRVVADGVVDHNDSTEQRRRADTVAYITTAYLNMIIEGQWKMGSNPALDYSSLGCIKSEEPDWAIDVEQGSKN